MNFNIFKTAVAKKFAELSQNQLYRTSVTGDELWDKYLESFPEGSNPVYRERTEHDCSCCKQFIRSVGNVVGIVNGILVSIWDIDQQVDNNYHAVAEALSELVRNRPIDNVFFHFEGKAGTDKTFEQLVGSVKAWEHFSVNIPQRFINRDPGSLLGAQQANYDVTMRGLIEISPEAISTVIELIAQGSLYRGDEHLNSVRNFERLQKEFNNATSKEIFVWQNIANSSAGRIRNSVIGTLLVDLSEGVDLDRAVSSFEAKVAPTNYKRPTALVTPRMVEEAKKTIESLGLLSALDRRYAVESDIVVTDVLFKSRSTVGNDDPFSNLATAPQRRLDKVEQMKLDDFLANVLPKARKIELLFEGRLGSNLMSLIAPCDPTANPLFKWDNNFSWSYKGELTDSIKERVKQAGGNVSGDLCCRLAWYNYDDLDLHMIEPGGNKIYFGRKRSSLTGGELDVDMNAGNRTSRTPVENIYYPDRGRMVEGTYTLDVQNFSKRETTDVGFEVEVDFLGTVYRFTYEKPVTDRAWVNVLTFKYTHKDGIEILSSLPSSSIQKDVWGIKTEAFHEVNLVTLSPSFWGKEEVGNKHVFFILKGCVNPEETRGFYNEFLDDDLTQHRKVFEVLGSRMKVPHSSQQLSGIGFSSTQRNSVQLRVSGAFSRIIEVNV